MKQYLPLLKACPIFDRMNEDEMLRMLSCLDAKIIPYERGRIILHQGDEPRCFGVVLKGIVHVMRIDDEGNHTIVAPVEQGDLFGETFSCAGAKALPVSVAAAQDCEILLLEHARVITGCRNGCMAHSLLVTNLMRIIAQKNLMINEKLSIITRRTTREKLMAYLRAQQRRTGSKRFSIPFDRQALSDYLVVERSAMCAQLSRLKKEGLIDYCKNEFEILQPMSEAHKEVHHG